jgi:hypothetical protein
MLRTFIQLAHDGKRKTQIDWARTQAEDEVTND